MSGFHDELIKIAMSDRDRRRTALGVGGVAGGARGASTYLNIRDTLRGIDEIERTKGSKDGMVITAERPNWWGRRKISVKKIPRKIPKRVLRKL